MRILTHYAHPPELFMRRRNWKALLPLAESDYIGYVYPSWLTQLKQFIPKTLMKQVEEKAHYLPLGVNTKFYSSKPYPEQQQKLIVTMAYWHMRKGLHKLIQAMEYLPTWKLVIIGTFKTETAPSDPYVAKQWNLPIQLSNIEYKNFCLDLAKKHSSRIWFIGWAYAKRKKYLLHKASVFVLPTWTEACCIASLEAMACACPVLITDTGGSPDHVPSEELISQFITPEELADRIRGFDKQYGLINQLIAENHDVHIANQLKQNFLMGVDHP